MEPLRNLSGATAADYSSHRFWLRPPGVTLMLSSVYLRGVGETTGLERTQAFAQVLLQKSFAA